MALSFEEHLKEDYQKRYIEYSPMGKEISALVSVAGLVATVSIIIEMIGQINRR